MLTHVQKRALDFITERLLATAIPPTRKELAEHLGSKHKARAQSVVDCLVERGFLRRIPRRPHNIELLPQPASVERVQYFRFDDETKQFVEWRP